MSEFEVWVGDCHLQMIEGGTKYQCQAAVWANSYDSFRATLATHLQDSHKLLWVEECLPVMQYITRHGQQARVGGLARAVHPGHSVELGKMVGLGDGEQVAEPESYLSITEIEGVEPLDLQMGAWPLKTIPDALQEPLFGQPAPTEAEIEHYGNVGAVPPMKTYAILDAAKMPYLLTSLLEDSELRYQSLFQGQTQEDLKEHAPYLVELEDNNSFTRTLFTGPKGVNGLREKELGIYVRSRAGFDEVRKHFRKLTRIQDEAGKWFFFRFWEPETAPHHFDYLASKNEASPHWFVTSSDVIIHGILIADKEGATSIIRYLDNAPQQRPSGAFVLSQEEVTKFKTEKRNKSTKDIAARISHQFPQKPYAQVLAIVEASTQRFGKYGFYKRSHLVVLASWEVFYGEGYEDKDPQGQLKKICQSSRDEGIRFQDFRTRMEEFRFKPEPMS